MESQSHICPMFQAVGSLNENGGTSCGNCQNFYAKHIPHAGKELCSEYENLVEWVRRP